MEQSVQRKRKSEKMTPKEHADLKKYVSEMGTRIDAALNIGVSLNTLADVLIKGYASPSTVEKVRAVIRQA